MFKVKGICVSALIIIASSAFAEDKSTRDLITKISEIRCVGDGHDLDVKWDSAVSPMGPTEIILDGRKLSLDGMRMVVAADGSGSTYETAGLEFAIKNANRGKKSFATDAKYMGRKISLKCTNHESTKFFRKREVERASPSNSGGTP